MREDSGSLRRRGAGRVLLLAVVGAVAGACGGERPGSASAEVATAGKLAAAQGGEAGAGMPAGATATSGEVKEGEAAGEGGVVIVYKSPTCGCCGKWVEHLRASGFPVEAHDLADVTPVKTERGVPERLRSCHTALVSGYVIEGHVPADVIRRLLEERLDVLGLAVPGMPVGSPGMEGPNPQPYEVLAFGGDGSVEVYAKR